MSDAQQVRAAVTQLHIADTVRVVVMRVSGEFATTVVVMDTIAL